MRGAGPFVVLTAGAEKGWNEIDWEAGAAGGGWCPRGALRRLLEGASWYLGEQRQGLQGTAPLRVQSLLFLPAPISHLPGEFVLPIQRIARRSSSLWTLVTLVSISLLPNWPRDSLSTSLCPVLEPRPAGEMLHPSPERHLPAAGTCPQPVEHTCSART